MLRVLVLSAQVLSAPAASAVRPAPPGDRPVHVWLGSSGPIAPGDPVRVYIETATDGYLLVLRAGTDGRIEVLFPADPTSESYARTGTYEIRRAGDAPAFLAAEPTGSGVVLAALSPTPYRFDEFLSAGRWNPDALVASWSGASSEAALTDIVQRMLGDGYFNYDFVSYAVLPRAYAVQNALPAAPTHPPCYGCSFAPVTVVVTPLPFFVCDPFTAVCGDFIFFPHFLHRHFFRHPLPCDFGSPCSETTRPSVIALATRPTGHLGLLTRRRSSSPAQLAMPRRPLAPLPIEPRPRRPVGSAMPHAAVAVRALPLGGTRQPAVARRVVTAAGGGAAIGRVVRLVMPAVPERRAPSVAPPAERGLQPVAAVAPASRASAVAVAVPPARPAITPPAPGAFGMVPESAIPWRAASVQAPAQVSAGRAAVAAPRPQTMALPRAAWTGVRSGVAAGVGRRH